MKFSVLMSVYKNDDPEYFDQALRSVTVEQTLRPSEVVLVVDGPVSDALNAVVSRWTAQQDVPVNVVRSELNRGLSHALNLGLEHCRYECVARMDSDDVSVSTRFESQMQFMQENKDTALLGGWYKQYDQTLTTYLTDRKVPTQHAEIVPYARTRTPFNHVTAVFRKSAVVSVGGYPNIQGYLEDWWVSLRLIKHGHQLANLPLFLVDVRGDTDFIERRGGWRFVRSEWSNLFALHKDQLIATTDLVKNLTVRTTVRLLPTPLRAFVYRLIRRV